MEAMGIEPMSAVSQLSSTTRLDFDLYIRITSKTQLDKYGGYVLLTALRATNPHAVVLSD